MAPIFQSTNRDHPTILFYVKYSMHLMQRPKDTHELTSHDSEKFVYIVAYFLKARTVRPERENRC
jgi:hypothetical protein